MDQYELAGVAFDARQSVAMIWGQKGTPDPYTPPEQVFMRTRP